MPTKNMNEYTFEFKADDITTKAIKGISGGIISAEEELLEEKQLEEWTIEAVTEYAMELRSEVAKLRREVAFLTGKLSVYEKEQKQKG